MGNMLETESSGAEEDIEEGQEIIGGIEEEGVKKREERTAGDGMEMVSDSEKVRIVTGIGKGSSGGEMAVSNEKVAVPDGSLNSNLRRPSASASNSLSPRQFPAKDLLIPVKAPKLESNNSSSKTGGSLPHPAGMGEVGAKQKTPKFVPYEPYSCATRPITSTHTRKPSDSSSIVSNRSARASTVTTPETPTKEGKASFIENGGLEFSLSPRESHTPSASTTLLKERLRMMEKELGELMGENARLKKLFVDSIAGVSPSSSSSSDATNNNHHHNYPPSPSERVDNLNDALEVWRSKFLSSCVLVEQLTKDNQEFGACILQASDIIKDLKNTSTNLTQTQYQSVNEWLRKVNNLRSNSSTLFSSSSRRGSVDSCSTTGS